MRVVTLLMLLAVAGGHAEVLFYDGVTAAPRSFTAKNDGEFKFPRSFRYFDGSVGITKPGLSFPKDISTLTLGNTYVISDGSMTVVPMTQAIRYWVDQALDSGSSNLALSVGVLVRFSGTLDQMKRHAGVALYSGPDLLLFAGKTGDSTKWCGGGHEIETFKFAYSVIQNNIARSYEVSFSFDVFSNTFFATAVDTGATHLIVMSLNRSSDDLSWTIEIDPTDSSSPSALTCQGKANDLPMFDSLRFSAKGMKLFVDEIRIGTRREDVIPGSGSAAQEPATGFALDKRALDAIVIVKGERSEGTGFLGHYKGVTSLYSNIHLLMGNKGIRFLSSSGVQFKPLAVECAADRDLVRIAVSNPVGPALAIASLPASVQDMPVAVCPHAEGETTYYPVYGTLVGSGPAKVETDARFVEAQTGSPIIASNGSVVGIATLLRRANENWTNEKTPFLETRRFGCRIDTATSWIKVSPEWFSKEGDLIANRARLYVSMLVVMRAWARNPYLSHVPPYRWLSRGLKSWADAHNDLAERNQKRLRSSVGGDKEVFAAQVKDDVRTLKAEVAKTRGTPPKNWHVPFFKECWTDLDAANVQLTKLIDLIETKSLKKLSE